MSDTPSARLAALGLNLPKALRLLPLTYCCPYRVSSGCFRPVATVWWHTQGHRQAGRGRVA